MNNSRNQQGNRQTDRLKGSLTDTLPSHNFGILSNHRSFDSQSGRIDPRLQETIYYSNFQGPQPQYSLSGPAINYQQQAQSIYEAPHTIYTRRPSNQINNANSQILQGSNIRLNDQVFNQPHLRSSQQVLQYQQSFHPQYMQQTGPTSVSNFVQFAPMLPRQAIYMSQSVLHQPQKRNQQNDFTVFCPACHQQYNKSQVQQHIERHYIQNLDQFKLSAQQTTQDEQSYQPAPLRIQSRSIYPLVEPIQFETKQLDEVHYSNKYKVQNKDLNKVESNIHMRSVATQYSRPPLQIKSDQTDVYNCFDNIFKSKAEFSFKDLTTNNNIIAKKRQLDEWEKMRSQKEGYTIKNVQKTSK